MSGFLDDHWNRAKILWILFAVGSLTLKLFYLGYAILIAATVMSFIWKKDAQGDVYSHFSQQVKVFIIFIAAAIILALLGVLLTKISYVLFWVLRLAVVGVAVIGFMKANDKKIMDLIK